MCFLSEEESERIHYKELTPVEGSMETGNCWHASRSVWRPRVRVTQVTTRELQGFRRSDTPGAIIRCKRNCRFTSFVVLSWPEHPAAESSVEAMQGTRAVAQTNKAPHLH